MKEHLRTAFVLVALALLSGCGLQKHAQPTTVLKTEDFIGDSTTLPTDTGTSNPTPSESAPSQPISAAAASEGILNVTAVPGAPAAEGVPAQPTAPSDLIDAKIGELNGRPVRAQDLLKEFGPILYSTARDRKLTRDLWPLLVDPRRITPALENSTIRREEWHLFAQRLFLLKLNRMLEDQLLAEEARFSLKPEQKQGLRYLAQELAENARREAGGSRSVSQERLREQNMTERQLVHKGEAEMLIGYELSERLRKRIRTSWKDVRLYYERNAAEFNPPALAYFRLIQVAADKPESVQKVQKALDSGRPFAEVAAMPENGYNAKEGGKTDPRSFTGDYEKASLFSGALNQAAVGLKEGGYTTTPVDSGSDKQWLSLDKIERRNRPLSDMNVQLIIANRLNSEAFNAERRAYIDRLKTRATFTDLPAMATQLADIAAARYWPKE